MNNVQLAKTITTTVVRLGTGNIICSIVRNNTTPTNAFDKISIPAGSFVLGSIVADVAKVHTERIIDDVVTAWRKAKNDIKTD